MSAAVTLRTMTADEYDAWTAAHKVEVTRQMSSSMTEDEALDQAVNGLARFLPDGVATRGHQVLVAENAAGEPVGNAWLGPDPMRPSAVDSAWLYDISVLPDVRRQGYGESILAALEERLRSQGIHRLGLNVLAHNEGATKLYTRHGFSVISQRMSRVLDEG